MQTHFHIIWREMGQALLLAGPGVVMSTIMTAAAAKYLTDYTWDWPTSLMFGAVVSEVAECDSTCLTASCADERHRSRGCGMSASGCVPCDLSLTLAVRWPY